MGRKADGLVRRLPGGAGALALALLLFGGERSPAVAADPPLDPQGVEFFEKRIRPVLTEQCLRCHSAEAEQANKLKGGLLLDSRAGLRTGGQSGPAVVPGKAGESRLIKVLKYDGLVQMPPKGKLPDAVIADFEKWINLGAPDPRDAAMDRKASGMSLEDGRKFWAYRVPERPSIPNVTTVAWPVNEIDRFVLARLQARKRTPAVDADRSTLARRLYFDLTGLPPTPEQVDAFVAYPSADAYEKLVDALLASPHFGERWGRHWLDVARFGESLTLRGFILKEAWRYRDYVIQSFNADVPYDRFIREQIAGDLLPAPTPTERRRQLIATTFLTLGNTNLEEQDKKQLRMDVVDEQLDVIAKGFLAQTITCARCHDHKFDPIPTKDYYALAGILRNAKAMEHANVSKWIEMPLPEDDAAEAALKKHEQAIAVLQERIKTEKAKLAGKVGDSKGVLALKDVPGIVVDDAQAKKVGVWQDSKFSGQYIGDGYTHDQDAGKGEKTLTFAPELPATGKYEVRLAYSPGTNRATAVPVTVFSADGEKTIQVDMKKTPPIDGRYISLGEYRFEKNGQSFVIVSNEGTKGHVIADAVTFIPTDAKPVEKETPSGGGDSLRALEAELKRLQETGPKRQFAMTVVEEKQIEDAKVHVRGSVHNLSDLAPRGFLQVATAGKMPALPKDQSGRRELADWIAARDNPLTARTIVNRVWHWLFGAGIVHTTDNFGTTGERPSHPELLDYLAVTFMDEGWSIKQLVRRIVLSRTYRQSSLVEPEVVRADPENRLFGRANRRRLEAEAIRDTMLTVSGKLVLDQGGPTYPANLAADYGFKPNDLRRSVYSPIFRNALPEILEVFDFADSSMVTGRRNVSTVAPQALFLLNHPFAVNQARAAAARLLAEKLPDEDARITRAYRLTLGREPTDGERGVAGRFLADRSRDSPEAWARLFQALFASADFRYVN